MDKETKDCLLSGIRACILELNNSENALSVVNFNLQSGDDFQGEQAITHMAIENIKQVRHMLNKLELEYL